MTVTIAAPTTDRPKGIPEEAVQVDLLYCGVTFNDKGQRRYGYVLLGAPDRVDQSISEETWLIAVRGGNMIYSKAARAGHTAGAIVRCWSKDATGSSIYGEARFLRYAEREDKTVQLQARTRTLEQEHAQKKLGRDDWYTERLKPIRDAYRRMKPGERAALLAHIVKFVCS